MTPMVPSVDDLRAFYGVWLGRVVRRVVGRRIRDFWPDVHGLSVMGACYAVPYLRAFLGEADRVFAVMSEGQGAHNWPSGEGEWSLVCLSEEGALPIETNSVDRIVMVHGLEFSDMAGAAMDEAWRVLKSNGRLLLVVPHRGGFWSRADDTPFGQGAPYSGGQVRALLRRHLFVYERSCGALYFPPFVKGVKVAQWIERFGQRFLPFGAGVLIVEASKQLYAPSGPSGGSKVGVGSSTVGSVSVEGL